MASILNGFLCLVYVYMFAYVTDQSVFNCSGIAQCHGVYVHFCFLHEKLLWMMHSIICKVVQI